MTSKNYSQLVDLLGPALVFFGTLSSDHRGKFKRAVVDNPEYAGEKRCRKKNFFDRAFAVYFAVLTAGNIPIEAGDFKIQVWNSNLRSLVNHQWFNFLSP